MVAACAVAVDMNHRLPANALGQMFSLYATGALVGALIATRLGRARLGVTLLGALGVMAAGGAALGCARSVLAADAAALIAGVGRSIALMMFTAIRIQLTPDAMLGRVGAVSRLLVTGATPLALAAAGPCSIRLAVGPC
jgi:hypothetical protein